MTKLPDEILSALIKAYEDTNLGEYEYDQTEIGFSAGLSRAITIVKEIILTIPTDEVDDAIPITHQERGKMGELIGYLQGYFNNTSTKGLYEIHKEVTNRWREKQESKEVEGIEKEEPMKKWEDMTGTEQVEFMYGKCDNKTTLYIDEPNPTKETIQIEKLPKVGDHVWVDVDTRYKVPGVIKKITYQVEGKGRGDMFVGENEIELDDALQSKQQ